MHTAMWIKIQDLQISDLGLPSPGGISVCLTGLCSQI